MEEVKVRVPPVVKWIAAGIGVFLLIEVMVLLVVASRLNPPPRNPPDGREVIRVVRRGLESFRELKGYYPRELTDPAFLEHLSVRVKDVWDGVTIYRVPCYDEVYVAKWRGSYCGFVIRYRCVGGNRLPIVDYMFVGQ